MALTAEHGYWRLAWLYTAMGFGLAFCDVLADAIMVETGKPRGLTGVFQSVQWASISVATLAVGVLGGYLAHVRSMRVAFALAACFPLVSFAMVLAFLREAPSRLEGAAAREAFQAIRQAAFQYVAKFDRGLGHAMAHEVGHLLLGVHSHALSGLMTADWHALETHLQPFTPEQAQVIRVRATATDGRGATLRR